MPNIQKTILGVEESASKAVKAVAGDEGEEPKETAEGGLLSPKEMAEESLTPEETSEVAQTINELETVSPTPAEEATEDEEIARFANNRASMRHNFIIRRRDALKARLNRR